ncbi:MAG: 2-oxoglutarate dehydrogenase E1 component, partial [Gammaproteobacteria bacterium]|nr:2-oxoglutarate dehydrogenase E1 component [Gammaproteobacteria bacterium]
MGQSYKDRYDSTPLHGGNAAVVEEFYERYLEDPESVAPPWRDYFRSISNGASGEIAHGPVREAIIAQAKAHRGATAGSPVKCHDGTLEHQSHVLRLINDHRLHGYLCASLDPLGMMDHAKPADLDPAFHGLHNVDPGEEFVTADLPGPERRTLNDILGLLDTIYGGRIGMEFSHISNTAERLWLRERFEMGRVEPQISEADKMLLLKDLTAAEGMERYLHTRYVGQKRFSLEGGDSLIPLVQDMLRQAGENDVEEVVLGMAHRGRLNVLVNVLGKSPAQLFSEFEGGAAPSVREGSGDVKYHMGFSADLETSKGSIHVVLAFNPSHLEIVNPVVEGSVRARQERRGDFSHSRVMPVLVHGDAAFAGQGVVMETFQMSQARGFDTGGTVHIICNNQIGFTISDPQDARSTPFCSDVAKMIEAPIIHVNGDDPEAVLFAGRIALDYRLRFAKDVVIDLVCYRRHGHNEADEPAATQPQMYQKIRQHPTTRALYAKELHEAGVIGGDEAELLTETYRGKLDHGEPVQESLMGQAGNEYTVDWSRFLEGDLSVGVETRLPAGTTQQLGEALLSLPNDLVLQNRVKQVIENRGRMLAGELPMDWGFAENMAYASLINDGYAVRLTGQDSGRGTFFHRHAVLHDQSKSRKFIPLRHIKEDQPMFRVTDSLLSEEAVMGFEYGYSTTDPDTLVIWEGQFGDFANGAQVVIDQFISSGEAKWGRASGLVLFLPHGYEGQGPEHSSARLERYLQLCAEWNMQVCVPSTPAQMFHMLRRQMLRDLRKPLIVMTPKSLLRHKESVSDLKLLEAGGFQLIIADNRKPDPAKVTRIIFCSGKVYYDLDKMRREHEVDNVAIVRIEQLYPFTADYYAAELDFYPQAKEVVWCQEEPQNQGAWYQIRHRMQ